MILKRNLSILSLLNLFLFLGLYSVQGYGPEKIQRIRRQRINSDIRPDITDNGVATIRVIPVVVDFTIHISQRDNYELNVDDCIFKLFGTGDAELFSEENSMNSYFNEISYGRMVLVNDLLENGITDGYFRIGLDKSSYYYNWGYTIQAGSDSKTGKESSSNTLEEFDIDKAKELTLDVFAKVLKENPNYNFQDKLVILILNEWTTNFAGRTAMCLVPGVTAYPGTYAPSNQELFVGHYIADAPIDPKPITLVRRAWFIDSDYPFLPDPEIERNYITEREQEFNNYNDEFVKGVCIFLRDAEMSCATHDVLHAVKRISGLVPTYEFLGKRSRALSGLYNLSLQGVWQNGDFSRDIYCTPYIGWWDNMGDHLHHDPSVRGSFLSGVPYGMCAYSRWKLDAILLNEMGWIRKETYVTDVTFHLVPLTNRELREGTKRALKLDFTDYESLLIEYRRRESGTVDSVIVDVSTVMGDVETDPGYNSRGEGVSNFQNPPDTLVPDDGILIYHYNGGVRQYGCAASGEITQDCPQEIDVASITSNCDFVTNFLLFLYTPSMMSSSGNGVVSYPNWDASTERNMESLKYAAFKQGDEFTLWWNDTEFVTVNIGNVTDEDATIRVTKQLLGKGGRRRRRLPIRR